MDFGHAGFGIRSFPLREFNQTPERNFNASPKLRKKRNRDTLTHPRYQHKQKREITHFFSDTEK